MMVLNNFTFAFSFFARGDSDDFLISVVVIVVYYNFVVR